jgi:hypothetical protein
MCLMPISFCAWRSCGKKNRYSIYSDRIGSGIRGRKAFVGGDPSLMTSLWQEKLRGELDAHLKVFEELADRRPFAQCRSLRDPNDVREWEKQVELWGDDDEQVSWFLFLITTHLIMITGSKNVYKGTGNHQCA